MTAKKRINVFWAAAFKIALRTFGLFINRITHEPSRLSVQGAQQWMLGLVTALSDADPDDSKQIQAITNRFFTDSPFAKGSRAIIDTNIAKLQNENVRTIFSALTNQAYMTADLLTDENEDNSEQLLEMAKQFGRSEDGLKTMIALFAFILDQEAAEFIAELIREYMNDLWSRDPDKAEAIGISIAQAEKIRDDIILLRA